jgi:methylated-DNA-[protein]-cysteine S-methyltransferase
VLWENEKPDRVRLASLVEDHKHPILLKTAKQLNEYFAGKRQIFDLPLDFSGTEFQQKVWQALLTIPFGETCSYKQIAEQIGNVKAVRAVGAANGKNPISIIAPCHRVVGANGKLVGFAGGLENKDILLKIEKLQ